jgi:hypothetical protein
MFHWMLGYFFNRSNSRYALYWPPVKPKSRKFSKTHKVSMVVSTRSASDSSDFWQTLGENTELSLSALEKKQTNAISDVKTKSDALTELKTNEAPADQIASAEEDLKKANALVAQITIHINQIKLKNATKASSGSPPVATWGVGSITNNDQDNTESAGKQEWDAMKEEDKTLIIKTLVRRKSGLAISPIDLEQLQNCSQNLKNFLLFELTDTKLAAKSFLTKNDIFEFKFNFKYKKAKVIVNKLLNNVKNVTSQPLSQQFNTLSVAKANLFRQSVVFHFTVLGSDNTWSDSEICFNVATELYEKFLGQMLNTDVLFESVQIKKKFPQANISTRRSIAFSQSGTLSPENNVPSNRPFIFNLASIDLPGDFDSYSLRLPFVSQSFNDSSSYEGGTQIPFFKISNICDYLAQPMLVKDASKMGGPGKLLLKLTVVSQSQNALSQYGPVSFVSSSGFLMDMSNSVKLLPVVNPSENSSGYVESDSLTPASVLSSINIGLNLSDSKLLNKLKKDVQILDQTMGICNRKKAQLSGRELASLEEAITDIMILKLDKQNQLDALTNDLGGDD